MCESIDGSLEYYKTIRVDCDLFDPEQLLLFLEQAGGGCISGKVIDWPQLKPACKWAAEEIKRLRSKNV